MDSTVTRLLAVVLLLTQGVVAMAAGRTIHLPGASCEHHDGQTEQTVHEAGCDASCGGHGHDLHDLHGHHGHTAHAARHHHHHHHDSAGSTREPASTTAAVHSDCGCHVHLPVPDRTERLQPSVTIDVPAPDRRRVTVTPVAAHATAVRRMIVGAAAEAWLDSDQVRARAVTSLRV